MTTKELIHVVQAQRLFAAAAVSGTQNTAVLDTFRQESAGFLLDIPSGNFSGAIGLSIQLQESDLSGSGFAAPPSNLFVEVAQDGLPGYPDGAGGWVALANVPASSFASSVNPILLQHANYQNHLYTISYSNGLKRYIRLALTAVGAPSNLVAVYGLLNSPQETRIRAFTNYGNDLSLTWPVG